MDRRHVFAQIRTKARPKEAEVEQQRTIVSATRTCFKYFLDFVCV